MTRFRPCIDLHNGKVKQIVGATLSEDGTATENFVADQPASFYAQEFAENNLAGGHVIKLGPGNEDAAKSALHAFPKGLQIGGGIDIENAASWLARGASHVIVTSWLFDERGRFQLPRITELASAIGKENIVIDLSCKRTDAGWTVAMNRWQDLTDLAITPSTLDELANYCDEFLIHAADVEGRCQGIDVELVTQMGNWGQIPMTYAGGVRDFSDVKLVEHASQGNVDVTVGSALDIFGGHGVTLKELVQFNQRLN